MNVLNCSTDGAHCVQYRAVDARWGEFNQRNALFQKDSFYGLPARPHPDRRYPSAEESPQKPRMPIESFRHEEKDHPDALKPAIDACDRTPEEYWQKIGRTGGLSWSANMALHYRTISRLIKSVAKKQGFTIEV